MPGLDHAPRASCSWHNLLGRVAIHPGIRSPWPSIHPTHSAEPPYPLAELVGWLRLFCLHLERLPAPFQDSLVGWRSRPSLFIHLLLYFKRGHPEFKIRSVHYFFHPSPSSGRATPRSATCIATLAISR